ncbi:MAG: drug resistance transporter, EmrB/QacA subfamily, partial [Frankiales bacterium]|nr:drug resistance transporter, EmrB/QacA subfamily [Frankiales bacterium]
IQKLPSYLGLPFKTGFSNTLDLVFLVAAAVVGIGFFVMLFLPQVPLRSESGLQARQSAADATDGGAGTPAEGPAAAVGAAAPTSAPPASAPVDGEADGGTASGINGTPSATRRD